MAGSGVGMARGGTCCAGCGGSDALLVRIAVGGRSLRCILEDRLSGSSSNGSAASAEPAGDFDGVAEGCGGHQADGGRFAAAFEAPCFFCEVAGFCVASIVEGEETELERVVGGVNDGAEHGDFAAAVRAVFVLGQGDLVSAVGAMHVHGWRAGLVSQGRRP